VLLTWVLSKKVYQDHKKASKALLRIIDIYESKLPHIGATNILLTEPIRKWEFLKSSGSIILYLKTSLFF
jgi:hypothetical protein